MSATKFWDDDDNRDGKRFDVTFQLISHTMVDAATESVNVVDEQTVGSEDGASYVWTDLDLITEDGKPIFYTVAEAGMSSDGMIGDYTVSVSGSMGEGFLITNHYKPARFCVGVTKHWDDNADVDRKRPETLTVHLSSTAGLELDVELNEANGWTHLERSVPMYFDNGTRIEYTWTEPELDKYESTTIVTAEGTMTVFYNRHVPNVPEVVPEPELTSSSVTKIWDDNNNAAGKRPTSLRVTLSNGDSYILNAANNWSITVDNLPKFTEDGKEISYTWSEQTVISYKQTDKRVVGTTTIFTNTYRPPYKPGENTTIEETPTPLGIDVEINHVGDCFD
jgi:hypothetical protein